VAKIKHSQYTKDKDAGPIPKSSSRASAVTPKKNHLNYKKDSYQTDGDGGWCIVVLCKHEVLRESIDER
jgi:hypothetical protein